MNFAIDSVEEIKKIAGSLALFQDGPFGTKPDILYILRFIYLFLFLILFLFLFLFYFYFFFYLFIFFFPL